MKVMLIALVSLLGRSSLASVESAPIGTDIPSPYYYVPPRVQLRPEKTVPSSSRPPPPPSNTYLPPLKPLPSSPAVPTTTTSYLPPPITRSHQPSTDYLPPSGSGRSPSVPEVPSNYLPPLRSDYLPPPTVHPPAFTTRSQYLPPSNIAPVADDKTSGPEHAQLPEPVHGRGRPSSSSPPTEGGPRVKGAEQSVTDNYLPPVSGSSESYGARASEHSTTELAKYEFEYRVNDEFGNDFGHKESREGNQARGYYSVLLPDGRKQVVHYQADEAGFRPRIMYEEVATVLGPKTPRVVAANRLDVPQGPY
ncbi:proline-rich extensin-like protein EPR1 [Copidosoma floridanum]|uniref:proline-rich extensin-like protein EPR1 n=1 Tax=Copidosoma floridanum TaxID=29053 RepID=UPI0006C9C081|nr:proline-rich extensin-like protein EPR1 [Copidosoma floridanum]